MDEFVVLRYGANTSVPETRLPARPSLLPTWGKDGLKNKLGRVASTIQPTILPTTILTNAMK